MLGLLASLKWLLGGDDGRGRELHDWTRRVAMLSVLSPDLEADADQLESRWGIRVALEMLREQVITPLDFLELCAEAARATGPASDHASNPAPRSQVA
jgi:hypothetical protein